MKRLIIIALIGIMACVALPACKKIERGPGDSWMENLAVKDAQGHYFKINKSPRSGEWVIEPIKGLAPNF